MFIRTEQAQLSKEVLYRVQAEQAALRGGAVGVIAPRSRLDEVLAAMDEAGLSYGTAGSRALDADVTVLPPDIAKGLEFDSVVIVEPGLIVKESNQGVRALYVSLTRTTNRLSLVYAEQLPEQLGGQSG